MKVGEIVMVIRDMKASINGEYFLAAEYEKTIVVFNAVTGERIGKYDTHFEWGGERICITNTGKYFAVAAYGRYGVSLYDTYTGETIWTNKEIKKIQIINVSYDDKSIYVINGDNILFELSIDDGKVLSKKKNVKSICVDCYGGASMDGSGNTISFVGEDIKTDISAFKLCRGLDRIFYSIRGGGIQCINKNGVTMWAADSNPKEHYLKLAYNEKNESVLALGYKFDEPREHPFYFLDIYDSNTGTVRCSKELDDAYAFTFINGSMEIVTGIGNVYKLGSDNIALSEKKYIFD